MKRYIISILTFLMISVYSFCQTVNYIDFYSSIKKYDLKSIWYSDSLDVFYYEHDEYGKLLLDRSGKIEFPKPLGFIGDQYERFYVHYSSVVRNKQNPYEYDVVGKTKVGNEICDFKGTIKVSKSQLSTNDPGLRYKQGIVYCAVDFFEDSTYSDAGFISGNLISNFILDSNHNFSYDYLDMISDGFCNNQFTGIWKSYKNKLSKKCNWGDYRIPDCGDLDCGAGEFSVVDKYLNNGWQNYREAHFAKSDSLQEKAKTIESEKWWK